MNRKLTHREYALLAILRNYGPLYGNVLRDMYRERVSMFWLTRPSFWAAMAALEDMGYVTKRGEVVGDYDSRLTLYLFTITGAGLEAL